MEMTSRLPRQELLAFFWMLSDFVRSDASQELERVEGLLRQETMDGFGADFDQDGIAEESFMDEDDDDGGGANRSLSFDE